MTIREYLSDKLQAYGISEASFLDLQMSQGLNPDADVTSLPDRTLALLVIALLEEKLLAPHLTNVSEGGFSMSWDYGNAARYYLWLCRKWSVKPSDDILTLVGLSVITDRTDRW